MNLYIYDGPVYMFATLVDERWKAETRAGSVKKAKSNLSYQFKKQHGFVPSAKISVDEKYIRTQATA